MGCPHLRKPLHYRVTAYQNPLNIGAQLYSLGGGIFLLVWGQFIYFFFPEWCANIVTSFIRHIELTPSLRQIYGGIGLGVAVTAALSILALFNVRV